MTDIDNLEQRLYDIRRDPKQMENIADNNKDICKTLRNRIWTEAGGSPPKYDIVRRGHDWYEYPDIYDPTTLSAKRLRQRYT